MLKEKIRTVLAGSIALTPLLLLLSCSNPNASQQQNQRPPQSQITQLQPATYDKQQVVAGQTVYVPIYSHIYYSGPQHLLDLSATLSIRNTDPTHSIIITALRYYDTNGRLIRQSIEQPVELKPLASTDVFVETEDVAGGLGANFIVEWVAEKVVHEPVIEAVMLSTASAQGISFVSPGRVLKQQGIQPVNSPRVSPRE